MFRVPGNFGKFPSPDQLFDWIKSNSLWNHSQSHFAWGFLHEGYHLFAPNSGLLKDFVSGVSAVFLGFQGSEHLNPALNKKAKKTIITAINTIILRLSLENMESLPDIRLTDKPLEHSKRIPGSSLETPMNWVTLRARGKVMLIVHYWQEITWPVNFDG